MDATCLHFCFTSDTPTDEIKDLVAVAVAAAEGMCGPTALLLESPVSVFNRTVEVDDRLECGRCFARVFSRLAERSLNAGQFTVRRAAPSGLASNGAMP